MTSFKVFTEPITIFIYVCAKFHKLIPLLGKYYLLQKVNFAIRDVMSRMKIRYICRGSRNLQKLVAISQRYYRPVLISKAGCKGNNGRNWLHDPGASSQSEGNSSKWLIWLVCREPLHMYKFANNIRIVASSPGHSQFFNVTWSGLGTRLSELSCRPLE